jgi:hypothetical protein
MFGSWFNCYQHSFLHKWFEEVTQTMQQLMVEEMDGRDFDKGHFRCDCLPANPPITGFPIPIDESGVNALKMGKDRVQLGMLSLSHLERGELLVVGRETVSGTSDTLPGMDMGYSFSERARKCYQ